MRVLILSQYFWPESFRINEVAQSLREAGCDVTVLTGQPNYPDGTVYSGYRAFSTVREEFAGCTVYRVPLAPRGRASAIRLVANYLSFVAGASLIGPWLLRGQRFDVIFVYGISPILQAIPGLVLRRTTGGALVPWVQDLWPQSLEVTGFVRNPRLLRVVGSIVRWIYRRSDLLLVQSRGFIPFVKSVCGGTPVEYHPNPGERAFEIQFSSVSGLVLDSGFNVVFAGNLGTAQALDTILSAAQILHGDDRVRFVLIGSGSRSEWLKQEVSRLGLRNVQLPGYFPPQQMPNILAQASVLLVSLVRSPIMSQTIPSKIQAYLAAGRPIIAALDGEGADVVAEASAGVTCPAEDSAALAEGVRKMLSTSDEARERMGQSGRQYYERHFKPSTLARRLVQRFASLVTERRQGAGMSGSKRGHGSDNG
jgi:glycosyltransferase involved in cell wall biosynthesis